MSIIIADASPLIALATVEQLDLLQKLYGSVIIPQGVERELCLDSDLPGSRRLKQAIDAGWLKVNRSSLPDEALQQLLQILDAGESEAILLSESLSSKQSLRFLLIDERKGRIIAQKRGIRIAGTGAILIAAKNKGHIDSVRNILDAMQDTGYRLSNALKTRLLQLANE